MAGNNNTATQIVSISDKVPFRRLKLRIFFGGQGRFGISFPNSPSTFFFTNFHLRRLLTRPRHFTAPHVATIVPPLAHTPPLGEYSSAPLRPLQQDVRQEPEAKNKEDVCPRPAESRPAPAGEGKNHLSDPFSTSSLPHRLVLIQNCDVSVRSGPCPAPPFILVPP